MDRSGARVAVLALKAKHFSNEFRVGFIIGANISTDSGPDLLSSFSRSY